MEGAFLFDFQRQGERSRGHLEPSRAGGEATILDGGGVPDDDEIARAIKNMKNGKAAGDDGVAAESLKYGGPRLQQEVCRIVKEMWVKASLSEYGHEADDWPSEWKVAIQVPVWKRKGKKNDKKHVAWDHASERGNKGHCPRGCHAVPKVD